MAFSETASRASLLAWPGMVAWGDVPTWIAVIGGLTVAAAAVWQLGLQRQQLRDQQRDIARQAAQLERQQANLVDVEPRAVNGAQAGVLPRESTLYAHAVMVINGSGRPIRNVVSTIWTDHPSFAAAPTRLNFANRIGCGSSGVI